jgi:hypothetical protein
MTTADLAKAGEQSTPPPDADSAAEQSMARLLRPYLGSFAAVEILQVIGAIAGLAPLLAVVELGRTLFSSGIGHIVDNQVQLSLDRPGVAVRHYSGGWRRLRCADDGYRRQR